MTSCSAAEVSTVRCSPSAQLNLSIAPAGAPWSLRALLLLLAASTAMAAWADDPAGKAAYARVCAQCHGDDPGDGGDGPALIPMYRSPQQVLGIVRSGNGKMHPLPESKISDAEVVAIVGYLQMLSK
jgi:mono/diheme cytochrome c family protein